MDVTILGSGNMGSAIAARLVDTGHQVTTWDRTAEHAQHLADLGVTVASQVQSAVSTASVVITMVTDGEAVHAIAEQLLPAFSRRRRCVATTTGIRVCSVD